MEAHEGGGDVGVLNMAQIGRRARTAFQWSRREQEVIKA